MFVFFRSIWWFFILLVWVYQPFHEMLCTVSSLIGFLQVIPVFCKKKKWPDCSENESQNNPIPSSHFLSALFFIPFVIIRLFDSLENYFSVRFGCIRNRNSRSLIVLLSIACRYCTLSIFAQSVTFPRRFFRIISSQILVLLPLPSMNGWATFITYIFLFYEKIWLCWNESEEETL